MMKCFILLILISLCLNLRAQDQKLGTPTNAVKIQGNLYVDSGAYLPVKLPTWTPLRSGAVTFSTLTGHHPYFWNATRWVPFLDSTNYHPYVDSFYAHLVQITDTSYGVVAPNGKVDTVKLLAVGGGGSITDAGRAISVAHISDMQSYSGAASTLIVEDTATGGTFHLVNSSSLASDGGVVFTAIALGGNNKWVRQRTPSKAYNVRWWGAKGDGVTDDRNAIQTAVNYVSSIGGGDLFFPSVDYINGKYYRDTLPVYWAAKVNMVGEGQGSLIYNDRVEDNNITGTKYLPIYYGNYQPQSYDSTQSRYYNVTSVNGNKIKITTAAQLDSFQVGQILIVRGLSGWFSKDDVTRPFKPYVVRITRVVGKTLPDTITIEDQIDTLLTGAKIAITGFPHFLPGCTKCKDENNVPAHFVSDVNVSNMSFRSKGQWLLRTSAYKINWNNIWTYGAEGIGGNAMAYCNWNNVRSFFWKQFSESSIGTHNTTIQNVQATYIVDTFLQDLSQPLIRFGENAHKVTLRNINIDAGSAVQRGIRANDATDCVVDGLTLYGPHLTTYGVVMETLDDTDIVRNILIKNSVFYLGSTQRYVEMNKDSSTISGLSGNTIQNCNFYGAVSSNSVKLDGDNALVRDSYFQYGDMAATGPVVTNAVVTNNYMVTPFQRITNVSFRGNRSANYILPFIFTDTTNSALGFHALYNIAGGAHNVAIGDYALSTDATRDGLTAIGSGALQNNTASSLVAVGYQALLNNSTGNYNHAFGYQAGLLNTTGTKNLYIMRQAGQNNVSGSNNIFIGDGAGASITNTDNNVIIGNSVDAKSASAANTLNLYNNLYADNFGTTSDATPGAGRFGINISTPLAFLHIRTSTNTYPSLILDPGAGPTAGPNGSIWNTTTHTYSRIGGVDVQLDNNGINPTSSSVAGTDETTSSGSITSITGLSIAVAANTKYKVVAVLYTGCSGTGGIKFDVQAPAGSTMPSGMWTGVNNSGSAARVNKAGGVATSTSNAFNSYIGSDGVVNFIGYITTSSTSGNIQIRFKSATGGETSTVFIGSTVDVTALQ